MVVKTDKDIKKYAEVSAEKLKRFIDPEKLPFQTTEEVPALKGIVGQDRGRAAMSFGLKVNKTGYNIYVAGLAGTGKTSYTKSIVKEFTQKDTELFDWCYVYNFEDRSKPKVLKLPKGTGKLLKQDMEDFVNHLKTDIPKVFQEESYQKDRSAIIRGFQKKSQSVFEQLNAIAQSYGFVIRQSGSGILSVPVYQGKPLREEDYQMLDAETQQQIEEKSRIVREKIMEFTRKLRLLEQETKKTLENLDYKVASAAVDYHMDELLEKYQHNSEILSYLRAVQQDILTNVDDFKQEEEEEEQQLFQGMIQRKNVIHKYTINLFIDHSETSGAPVVFADNPTYYNLLGKVEYENKMGMLSTDFTKIKPGYLHQANGGYLIIQAKDVLSNHFAWDALKRALKNQQIRIENIGEQLGTQAAATLRPDSIPLDVKVILIGGADLYQLLYHYDEDFRKLFKVRADFDVEMDYNEDNVLRMASFIHTRCEEDGLKVFDKTAVAKIVEFSARIVSHQQKLSTRFNQIVEIIYEADTWAQLMGDSVVEGKHVEKAIEEKRYRSSLYEEKLAESMEEGDILIDTEGEKVGQVNGLAVYQLGEYSFGKPTRITASTFVGQSGIVNIERESKMSGNIHNKGVYILAGYLGAMFAQEQPLALTAHLAFEQSYGGVDGDSASSTELYALLSSLADIPINQGLAVTGSVNQKGEIQPIGGVNEKIEGFFDLCKSRGLTGGQGVLIPHQNVKNLMLKDEVIEAVKEGKFHIYQVKTIEEGIELLTGIKAGKKNAHGEFEEGTVYWKVAEKLKKFIQYAEETEDE